MRELEAEVHRLEDRLRVELGATYEAVKNHVARALVPVQIGIDALLLWTTKHDEEARVRAQVGEELLAQRKAEDERVQRLLSQHQQAVDIANKPAVLIDARMSGDRQRRIAILVAVVTVGGGLLVAIVNSIASHLH